MRAARSVPIAAHGSSDSPTARIASAVEFVATVSTAGRNSRRKPVHCGVACGCDRTRRTSPNPTPGRAARWWRTGGTISASITTSPSAAAS